MAEFGARPSRRIAIDRGAVQTQDQTLLSRILLLATLVICSLAVADSGRTNDVRALLREGASLNADEVAALEAQLGEDPVDMLARARLLGYHERQTKIRGAPSKACAQLRSRVRWRIHHEQRAKLLAASPSLLFEWNRFLDIEAFVEGNRTFLRISKGN